MVTEAKCTKAGELVWWNNSMERDRNHEGTQYTYEG
jgi:hypothetical protein